MKLREHRGSLSSSIDTAVEIQPTAAAVALHVTAVWGKAVTADEVSVAEYGPQPDWRCGWNTHIVTVGGAVFGFTDGPLSPNAE